MRRRLFLYLSYLFAALACAWLLWENGSGLALTSGQENLVIGVAAVSTLLLALPLLRRLFGPVFFNDLVRSARRGHYVLLRCCYAGALLIVLFLLYWRYFGLRSDGFLGGALHPNDLSQFAEDFFLVFSSVQFVAVVFLTPALAAGALTEEKERKTFEYLLTTDLGGQEIVLGKLASRLAYLALVLLTGLPVLSLLQLLGGVDPMLLLSSFAVTALTMLSLVSLSILNSVYLAKTRTAILLTYVEAALYTAMCWVIRLLHDPLTTPNATLEWLTAGDVVSALQQLVKSGTAAGGATAGLGKIVAAYAIFHGVVSLVCTGWAVARLRAHAVKQASLGARRSFLIALGQKRKPRVKGNAMLWKELHAEPMFRFSFKVMIALGTAMGGIIVFGLFYMLCLFMFGWQTDQLAERMNYGVRTLGTFMACLMLLGVAVRAAGSFGNERERQTLDSLLTSPLESRDILRAKWWGSVLSGRRLGWFLGAVWLVGLLTGGLHPIALLLVLGGWLALADFAASLGLWYSLRCRTVLRATVATLLTVLLVSVGHWVLLAFFSPSRSPWARAPDEVSLANLVEQIRYGLTPPKALNALAFFKDDFEAPRWDRGYYYDQDYGPEINGHGWRLGAALVGVILYAVAGTVLYSLARARLKIALVRGPFQRPKRNTKLH